jgi:glycosyltransferase involved in cell wall biosynthesis
MTELNRPVVSVVIPHLNQAEMLNVCLGTLCAQSIDRSLYEIIVVDNGSKSPPAETVARYPGVRLLHEPQPGPGPARNAGIRSATGDILMFLDADCRAHPDWIGSAIRTFDLIPAGTILGGDVRIWRDDPTAFTAVEAYETVFGFRNKLYVEKQGYSVTANLAGRRMDLQKVAPFLGIQFAEDMDWGQRAREAGFRFHYVPEMIVFHPARKSLRELRIKWDRQIQHYLNMAQREPAWKWRWLLRSVAVLGSPIIDIEKVLRSDRIAGLSPRLKAIMILFAIRAHRARKMASLLRESQAVVWNREVGV